MTTYRRISDYPDGDETAAATAVVAQGGSTKSYNLGTAAGKNAGTSAGDLPILGTGGAVSRQDGGTGITTADASISNNTFFGKDGSGNFGYYQVLASNLSIADRSIDDDKLADNAVITRAIAADAVGRGQIKDGEVIASKLGAGAVGSAAIADGAVGTDQLAAHGITTGKYANASVTHAAMANNAVRREQIGTTNNGVAGQLLSLSTSGGDLVLTWVDASTPSIPNDFITHAMLQADAVEVDNIAITGTPTDDQVLAWDATNSSLYWKDDETGGGSSLPGDNTITNAMLRDGIVDTAELADDAVTAAKIDNGAITNAAVASNAAISQSKLADITLSDLPIHGTPADGQVPTYSSTNSRLEFATPSGGGGSGLTIGGTQEAGRVMLATGGSAQSWFDPENPGNFSKLAWGDTTSSTKISSTSPTNTYLIQQTTNPALYAIASNSFNASTQDLSSSPIPELLIAPNFNAGATSQVKVASSTFYGGLFGRSGGSNYVYISRTNLGQAYFWRDGSAWTQISSANSNTNLLKTRANIPQDNRWYPMTGDDLPDGIDFALGKSNGTDGLFLVELAWNAGFSTYGIDYTRYTTTIFTPSFRVGDGAVLTSKIADGAVTAAKMAAGVIPTSLPPSDDSVSTIKLQDDAVTQAKIGNNAVVTAAINNRAVTTLKIAQKAVNWGEIADNAIRTLQINNDAVTQDKIANNAVGADQIAAGAVGSSKIASAAVGSTQLAANAVSIGNISAANRAASRYLRVNSANSGLEYADVASGTPANNSITAAMLQSNSVIRSKINNDAVNGDKIADDAVGVGHLNTPNNGTAGQRLERTSTGMQWATGGAKITTLYSNSTGLNLNDRNTNPLVTGSFASGIGALADYDEFFARVAWRNTAQDAQSNRTSPVYPAQTPTGGGMLMEFDVGDYTFGINFSDGSDVDLNVAMLRITLWNNSTTTFAAYYTKGSSNVPFQYVRLLNIWGKKYQ